MFGWKLARIAGRSMEPKLPNNSIALFRRRKGVTRGDVVLVDHPEFGIIVRKVSAVGREANIHLRGTSRQSTSQERLGKVAPDRIMGTLVLRVV